MTKSLDSSFPEAVYEQEKKDKKRIEVNGQCQYIYFFFPLRVISKNVPVIEKIHEIS